MISVPKWAQLPASALDEKLGFELMELSAQRVVGRIPVSGNTQPFGQLHGGASAALVETLASLGATAHAHPLGLTAVGVDLNISHLCPARDGWVTGTARPLKLGNRVASYSVELTNDAGELVAAGRLTCQLIQAR